MEPATIIVPAAGPEEVAAITAALTQFTQDTAAPADAAQPAPTPWQRAALREGVERAAAWG